MVIKLARGKEIYIAKVWINNLKLQVFSSECSKKRRPGACSQEETCLQFNQAQGNRKAILVITHSAAAYTENSKAFTR